MSPYNQRQRLLKHSAVPLCLLPFDSRSLRAQTRARPITVASVFPYWLKAFDKAAMERDSHGLYTALTPPAALLNTGGHATAFRHCIWCYCGPL